MAAETVSATAPAEHPHPNTALIRLHDALNMDHDLVQAALGTALYLRGETPDADPVTIGLVRLLDLVCDRLGERSAELDAIRARAA